MDDDAAAALSWSYAVCLHVESRRVLLPNPTLILSLQHFTAFT
jgi:hypothetical protein